jgi:hypothetical protein
MRETPAPPTSAIVKFAGNASTAALSSTRASCVHHVNDAIASRGDALPDTFADSESQLLAMKKFSSLMALSVAIDR